MINAILPGAFAERQFDEILASPVRSGLILKYDLFKFVDLYCKRRAIIFISSDDKKSKKSCGWPIKTRISLGKPHSASDEDALRPCKRNLK